MPVDHFARVHKYFLIQRTMMSNFVDGKSSWCHIVSVQDYNKCRSLFNRLLHAQTRLALRKWITFCPIFEGYLIVGIFILTWQKALIESEEKAWLKIWIRSLSLWSVEAFFSNLVLQKEHVPSTGQKLNYKSSHSFPILQGGPEVIHFTAGVALCVICINVQSLIHVVAYFSLLCNVIDCTKRNNKTKYLQSYHAQQGWLYNFIF